MGINITLGETNEIEKEKPFPKILQHKPSKSLYLFHNETSCVSLTTWRYFIICNFEDYIDYNKPVTLQNE